MHVAPIPNPLTAPRVLRRAQVEDFWQLYVHLRRPVEDRPTVCDYHIFREGIRPMWEGALVSGRRTPPPPSCAELPARFLPADEANINGGKWIVRLRKGVATRYWEDVLLAVIGGQFRVGADEICGAVLSVRYQEDLLSIWNKSADSRRVCVQIRCTYHRHPRASPDRLRRRLAPIRVAGTRFAR